MSSKGNNVNNSEESNFHKSSDYQKAYEKWKTEVLEPSLEKNPERLKEFMTTSSQNFLVLKELLLKLCVSLSQPLLKVRSPGRFFF